MATEGKQCWHFWNFSIPSCWVDRGGFAPFLLGCFGAVGQGGVGGVCVNVRVHLLSMLMLREGRFLGWGWGWGGGVGPC